MTEEIDVRDTEDEEIPMDVIIGETVITKSTKDVADDLFMGSAEDFVGLEKNLKRRLGNQVKKLHAGIDDAKSKRKEYSLIITGYDLLDVVEPKFNPHYLIRLREISPPHMAASDAKVANIVGLGFDLIETEETQEKIGAVNNEDQRQKLTSKLRKVRRSFLNWIDDCNSDDEFIETLTKIARDRETTGNGYLEIGRTSLGKIGYLGHIPAETIRVRRKRDGFVQINDNKPVFFKHLGTDTVDPIGNQGKYANEIIHFKKFSPGHPYYGIPDIIPAIASVVGNEFASKYNLDYFENKAVPRYVIVTKGGELNKASQSSIVKFFETGLRTQNHRTLFIPLPADRGDNKVSFEMKPIEAGVQDSSFNNYNKSNLQNIFMAHRTPMSKAAVDSGTSLAAARDADKTFKESVCRPEQKIFEKKINRIFKELTNAFAFKLNELTLTDEDTQARIDERYLRNKVIVPNEVRARAGMPGIDGGDKPIELTARQGTDAAANTRQTRTRDSQRSASATDAVGEGRNAQGDGRSTG